MCPVSIIIPWIRRPGMERCVEAIKSAAQLPPHCYEIVAEEDTKRIGVPRMVAQLTDKSAHDLVMFLADDTVPQPGFLVAALKAMETLPQGWGLVALNDGFQCGAVATHWLADKRLLPLLGSAFFHPSYYHGFCDSELTLRCKGLGRYVYAPEAKIKHLHPHVGAAPWDADYARIYSYKWIERDHLNLILRKRKGWPHG